MAEKEKNRRQFIKIASIGAAVSLTGVRSSLGQVRGAQAGKQQFKLGLASYTLRKFNLDDTLAMTKRVGLKYICFKSMHLPLDSTPAQIRSVVAKVKEAGLILYGGGVISMKNEAQVHQAFDYAKAAGMKVIIGVPAPELLPLVNKKVRQYDIKVAIHNHGPGDKLYPIPARAIERIKDLDKRIGLCHDIGHTIRVGSDPIASSRKFADRLLDVHIKDVSEATAKGHGVEIGRGVIDIPKFLKMLVKIKYSGIVSFEYEKDADDPMAGLAESVGYVRGVLAAI
ncbi:MAG: sugar phosphate isomerase/epimerase [Planctomycetes bacterium]|nr:sugar phosphate isomerase/epimerase [Planctomycetota bacterium]